MIEQRMPFDKVAGWQLENIVIDALRREIRVEGVLVDLEPKPFDVLMLVLGYEGDVVTTEEILEAVWPGRFLTDSAVTNNIVKVRKALGDHKQRMIVTVPKIGYRLGVKAEKKLKDRDRPAAIPILKAGADIPGRPSWKLVEQLGPSGYGEAWLAEHDKTQERRVFKFCVESRQLSALKREVTLYRVLRRGLGARAMVAHIHDWQFDEPPYFIESAYGGPNLRAWFELRGGIAQVDLGERLGLVESAAAAVTLAHSIGVLHKDLKPENILVDMGAEGQVVRLCDFGAGVVLDAAALSQMGVTMAGFTQVGIDDTHSGPGTLVYLAPELFSREAPSVQSDVYALGVLLYQLVVGEWRPIAPGWEHDVVDPLLRADIAAATDGVPSRRLPSAQLLVDRLSNLAQRRLQLERERIDQAVADAARSALERARNRRPWIIVSGVVLVVGLIVTNLLYVQARREADIAAEQRNLAERFNEFIDRDIVRAASPDFGGRYDLSLKQAVSQNAPRIRERFAGEPLVEASLSKTVASVLNTLSDPIEAVKLAQRSAEVLEAQFGPDDPRTLDIKLDALSYEIAIGRAPDLEARFAPVFARVKAVKGASAGLQFKARVVQARIILMDGRWKDAIPLLASVLADYPVPQEGIDSQTLDMTRFHYIHATLYERKPQKIIDQINNWLPQLVRDYGADSGMVLRFRNVLGRAYASVGHRAKDDNYFRAESEFKEVREGYDALLGADSSESVSVLMSLADMYYDYRQWPEAIEHYRLAEKGMSAKYGPASQWSLAPTIKLVAALDAAGRLDEAVPESHRLLAIGRRYLQPGDYMFRYVLFSAAKCFLDAGRDAGASRTTRNLV